MAYPWGIAEKVSFTSTIMNCLDAFTLTVDNSSLIVEYNLTSTEYGQDMREFEPIQININ